MLQVGNEGKGETNGYIIQFKLHISYFLPFYLAQSFKKIATRKL